MLGSMSDLTVRMGQRKQRLQEEQKHFDRKQHLHAQNPDGISEPSELESSRQAPKPKRRHHRSSTKSPFDDDSSLQFGLNEKKSTSTTTTTSSTTPRQPKKFVKKPTTASSIPVTTEKLSVAHSPRDISSPRLATKENSGKKSQQPPPLSTSSTGLLAQSTLLARAVHRQQLYAKGIELEPGAFDQDNDEDESSSDVTSTSAAKILFGSGKKSFVKKSATAVPDNQVPDLQHLDSETNSSEREGKRTKHKKDTRPVSALDTEDDSSRDFVGDGSSSEGQKTPTLTPRKSILKSPKNFIPKESEHSVQFSERLSTVEIDAKRSTTPRRVQIAKKPSDDDDDDEIVPSETESISTAIDVVDEVDDISSNGRISESPVDNMFANLILTAEPLVTSIVKKKSPRRTSSTVTTKKTSPSPVKFHHTPRTISEVSDEENMIVEEIPEEISAVNYSEDFSSVPTETSTPRSPTPTNVRLEKQPPTIRKIPTDDQQTQVDLMSAPFQSSLNQVHSIYLINQNDLNEARPSSLIRSVVEPNVLQSLLTTNPILLAVDDLIREQSSLLRSFIQLQRTYYESTIRSIRPEHIYVTKDNTLQFIADQQQQSRMHFQSNDDSITN